ncbi:cytochrome P450 [Mycena latifolia]|nr:cytochrome P450 [Mycena latifolia]
MAHLLDAIGASLSLYLVWSVVSFVLNPLRKVPGPRLAALTQWYKAYFDLILDGGFLDHLKWLHENYGPVVRVGPNEVHFSHPDAFEAIYSFSSTFTKDPILYKAFRQDLSSFGLGDPREARKRREMLSPLFSRRAILKLEHVIQEKVELIENILSHEGDTPCNLFMAFRAATLDIITSYCFAQSFDALDYPNFQHPILLAILSGVSAIWTFKYFPSLLFFVENMPGWVMHRISPVSKGYTDLFAFLSRYLDRILEDPTVLEVADHEIIYHHLLQPDARHNVPSKKSLLDESLTLLGAGSETVGNIVTTGVFHVLSDKRVLDRLRMELQESWPNASSSMSYQALEKLPYLTAVLKESVKMAHGVVTPIPRAVGPSDAQICGYNLPPGTVVSIGITFIHEKPDIFHSPASFRPERWLESSAQQLEAKYFVPFSRGPRMCLGINLAWCELYLLFASIFRKIDMKIYETSFEDFTFQQHWLPVFRKRQFHARVKALRYI